MKQLETVAIWIAGVCCSGFLLYAALPPVGFAPAAWIALVPALIATHKQGVASAFAAGVSVCLVAAMFASNGLFLKPSVMDGDPGWVIAGYGLFALVVASSLVVRNSIPAIAKRHWILAAYCVLLEALLLLYLPAHLALTQSRSSLLLELTSWTGIWGVSYLVWFTNFLIADLLINRKWIVVCALTIIGTIASLVSLPAEKGEWIVAATQTRELDIAEHARLKRQAGNQGAQIVVWPELSGELLTQEELVSLAKSHPPFVTTFPDGAKPKPHNAAALFSAFGESQRYFKRKPFAGERAIHAAGNTPHAVRCGEYTVALAICFDSCFPTVMREAALQPDVSAILLPSKDPDTPYGIIQAIHASYTPFRAAECGLPIVRSDTTAYSQIIDNHGRTVAFLSPGEGKALVGGIRAGARWTIYKFSGDWFLWLCGLVVIYGCVSARYKRLGSEGA